MKTQVNEIQVSYHENTAVFQALPMKSSQDVAKLIYSNWDRDTIGLRETFKVLLMNHSNKVKGIYPLSVGGITGTMVDLRILFALVLKTLSTAIILTHNHPSGKLRPSEADSAVTQKIKKAGLLFDITVLDHLIIAPNGAYYSFKDNGLL
ncbi:JAB domain-containing protein [Zobellia russellii]|uniref:JAB domain-containing protein n=1 Tax=Zobellia russellii TaxID=248907 RepID=UPI001BFF7376|nr:JAB domain-containing protein [Zobellia russellii]MBT9190088.1 JAB domain-containing protein [Zobellia russellii]